MYPLTTYTGIYFNLKLVCLAYNVKYNINKIYTIWHLHNTEFNSINMHFSPLLALDMYTFMIAAQPPNIQASLKSIYKSISFIYCLYV